MNDLKVGDRCVIVKSNICADVYNGKHGVVNAVEHSFEHPYRVFLDGWKCDNRSFGIWSVAVPEHEPEADSVNHPSHYTNGEIECIDAIREATKHLCGFECYCTGNAITFMWRWKPKNGVEDLMKVRYHISELLKYIEKDAVQK